MQVVVVSAGPAPWPRCCRDAISLGSLWWARLSVLRPTWPARLIVDETFFSVNYGFTDTPNLDPFHLALTFIHPPHQGTVSARLKPMGE
jgi:hypothetical protein